MKLLFLKNLCLTNGTDWFNFKRMRVYNLHEKYALEFLEQGYACKFGFTSELPLTITGALYEPS